MAMPRAQRPTSDFRLPPEVTFREERGPGGWVYAFQHSDLGELGRILLQDWTDDRAPIVCEIAGAEDDPMTARRMKIFGPLTKEVAKRFDIATGGTGRNRGRGLSRLKHPPRIYHKFLTRLERCEKCQASLAAVALAAEAQNAGELEDCAWLIQTQAQEWNAPAWVIGPVLTPLPNRGEEIPAIKIWPERERMEILVREDFNAKLDALREAHRC